MAIEIWCSCGKKMLAQDQWAGRQVQCPQCGAAVTVAAAPLSGAHDPDVFQNEAKPSARETSPFAANDPFGEPKRGWFSWLFWKFPSFGNSVKWNEPLAYRVRLRGDVFRRLLVVFAVWAAGTGVLLALFALNRDPPGIPLGIGLGAIFGGIAALFVFGRRQHASGRVTVGQDGIRRNITYASLGLPGTWHEWSHWCYEDIDRCIIVPAAAVGKSFSLMFIIRGSDSNIVGLPRYVDFEELKGKLTAGAVPIELGKSVPVSHTKPLDFTFPLVVGAICLPLFLMGLSFYAIAVGGVFRPQALAEKAREERRQLQDVAPKVQRDTMRLENGLSQFEPHAQASSPPRDSEPTDAPVPDNSNSAPARGFGGLVDLRNGLPGQGMGPPLERFGVPGSPRGGSSRLETSAPQRAWAGNAAEPLPPGHTKLAGGNGGAPFQSIHPDRKSVVGFRYGLGSWQGQAALRNLEPLYDRSQLEGNPQTVVARAGYAVGAIQVDVSPFVTAVRIVFMRVTADGRLDLADSYTSEWIGEPSGNAAEDLGGTGARVIGVAGRRAAVLDAVGLVLETDG